MTTITETNFSAWRRQSTAFSYRNASELFTAEQAILKLLGPEVSRARLLDIGIGTGRTTATLAKLCAQYVGVDYSPQMIKRARSRFPAADLRVADARDLSDFAIGAFDLVVFSYNGIDYVDQADRLQILTQVRNVLSPGGAFIFSAHRLGVAIPSAWSRANIRLTANPLALANRLLKYGQGIRNARRMRPREQRFPDYALLNDSAQQYQLLTYYITPEAQQRQLRQAGFEEIRAFALDGAEITQLLAGDAVKGGLPQDDYMVHYMARRS